MILAIDPGPVTCGVCVLSQTGKVLKTHSTLLVADCLDMLSCLELLSNMGLLSRAGLVAEGMTSVAIERMQSYGIAGASLLATSEVVGRLQQRALDVGMQVSLWYRRDVLRALDVTGKGNRDSLVRQRLIEMFGGSKAVAIGKKASPGPLYGVTGHAWQALAVAVAAAQQIEVKETA